MSFLERSDGAGAEQRLIEIDNLHVRFGRGVQAVRAVDGVSLRIAPGESVGLVGESGCGKTTLGRTVVRLQDATSGRVSFRGSDISALRGEALKQYRRRVQMIFQDPYGSLNPRLSVGSALEEVLKAHGRGNRNERRDTAARLLGDVGLDAAHLSRYPHEFSGGQRQRVGIARALAVGPELVIADEPVSALDVSVQVQILNLLKDLQQQRTLAYLLVAHDLAVVRYVCTRVMVMYLGRIAESGPSSVLYTQPAHPYTQMLLRAVPDVDKGLKARKSGVASRRRPTESPSAQRPEKGCLFAPRCPLAQERCRAETPALREVARGRWSACHFAEDVLSSRFQVPDSTLNVGS